MPISKNYDLIIRINCNFTLNIFDNLLLIRPQYGQNMEVSMIKCDHYEFKTIQITCWNILTGNTFLFVFLAIFKIKTKKRPYQMKC